MADEVKPNVSVEAPPPAEVVPERDELLVALEAEHREEQGQPKVKPEPEPEPEPPAPEVKPEPGVKKAAEPLGLEEQVKQLMVAQGATQAQIAELLQRVIPRPEPPPRKTWALPKVKPEDMDEIIMGSEEGAAKLNAILEGVGNSIAELLLSSTQQQIMPLAQAQQQIELERHVQLFKAKNPDLAEWEDLAAQQASVVGQEIQQGRKFNSWDEVHEEIAKRTRAMKQQYEERLGKTSPAALAVLPPPGPRSPGPRRVEAKLTPDEEEIRAVVMGE